MRHKKLKQPRRPKADMMPVDTSELMREIVRDPVGAAEAARDRYVQCEDNWRVEKYQALAVVYALGRFLKYHGSAWRKFSKNEFFDYRKRPLRPIKDQPRAMRHAAYLVLNAHNASKRDRAATYVRGLEVLARRNVLADNVVEEIVGAGGIEALAEEAKMDPSRPQRFERPFDEEYFDVSDEAETEPNRTQMQEGEGGDELNEREEPKKRSKARRSDESLPTLAFDRGRDPAGRRTIEFEVSSARQSRFFDLGEKQALVYIEGCGRDENNWQRIRVRKVIWKGHAA